MALAWLPVSSKLRFNPACPVELIFHELASAVEDRTGVDDHCASNAVCTPGVHESGIDHESAMNALPAWPAGSESTAPIGAECEDALERNQGIGAGLVVSRRSVFGMIWRSLRVIRRRNS